MLINKFEGICYDIEEEKENEFAFLDRDFENVLKNCFQKYFVKKNNRRNRCRKVLKNPVKKSIFS